jgi:hypothetical protein
LFSLHNKRAGGRLADISIEDDLVFPLAKRLLAVADKTAIGNEMAARRKVEPPGL